MKFAILIVLSLECMGAFIEKRHLFMTKFYWSFPLFMPYTFYIFIKEIYLRFYYKPRN